MRIPVQDLSCAAWRKAGPRGETALLFRARKYKSFRYQVAWLTIAALMWSSGQGAVMSAGPQLAGVDTKNLWHCLMPTGGAQNEMAGEGAMAMAMVMDPSAPMSNSAPMGDGPGYCPVCSLTGCSTPSVMAQADFQRFPPDLRAGDTLSLAHAAPLSVAIYGAAHARAPPLSA
jgi:hypothetical protein